MDIYSEIILDHYKNPRKKGKMANASATAEDANPLCGDKIRYYLKIDPKGKITDVRFSGSGCAVSQAAASMLAEECAGKNVSAVSKWEGKKIFNLLGVNLTPARTKCALLSLAVIKNAIAAYGKVPAKRKPASGSGRKPEARTNRRFDENNPYYRILNKVIDPDTQIGIADMGLIYGAVKDGDTAKITMTLTSTGCPAAPQFTVGIERLLRKQKGVKEVQIEFVWEPPWTPDMIKPELRSVLGF